MTIWSDVIGTLWPGRSSREGPLPPLLLLLTVVTGLVDATSYLKLGHVFVANMTGNVVFLGFAIAGAGGLSISASLLALGSFLAGSVVGGRLGHRLTTNRGTLLGAALGLQLIAVGAASGLAALRSGAVDSTTRHVLIALLAVGMGIQNATARRLAVPELTTTVLTMTLTGIAADSTLAGGATSRLGRRSLAIAAMFVGGLTGALLALKVSLVAPLIAATTVLVIATVTTYRLSSPDAAWTRPA
jgi:uncharacterized membrane protein YoaK (UPF0700 family)